MQSQDKFSCILMGEGSLPLQCAELLLERGHEIHGIICRDPSLRQWAEGRNITHLAPAADLEIRLEKKPFDYLFTIANEEIPPAGVLRQPRRSTINYHDALLPKYPVMNATSWAIMHRELKHGVTWHVMTNAGVAGKVLKKTSFELRENETAFTLNAKCYDAAIRSFGALIDELAIDGTSTGKWNHGDETYFSQGERPAAGCVLSWNCDAREIDAFVRALDFGPYPNPLGIAKLAIEEDFIIVPRVRVLESASGTPPGTLAEVDRKYLTISTKSRDVALQEALTVDGRPLGVADLVSKYELHKGYRLEEIDQEKASRIAELDAAVRRHEGYWVRRLAGLRPVGLPYSGRASLEPTKPQYESVTFSFPPETATFSRRRPLAGNICEWLVAALAVYLARVSGVCRYDIGFREVGLQRRVAGLTSLFALDLPLRVDLGCTQSFDDVLRIVRYEMESTKRHETYFRDLVTRHPALRAESSLRNNQAFAVCVAYVETLDEYEAAPGTQAAMVVAENEVACRWVFDRAVLTEDDTAEMLRQFETLLRGAFVNPGGRMGELPLVPESERRRILVEWNATEASYPSDKCIHQLFEAQAEHTPDAAAVVFRDRRLNYRQLNQRANRLARRLRELGVGRDVLVAICVERSEEMVVGLLGILKAGGAYVPLDPEFPRERLAFMLADSEASVLLTQQRLVPGLPEHEAHVLCVDGDWSDIAGAGEKNPHIHVEPADRAYVIYTSGSTGKPKGVQIPHRAAVNFLHAMRRHPGLTKDDVLLAITTLSFDIALLELFLPLIVGARVVVIGRETASDGEQLQAQLESSGATVMQATPATWRLLLESGWEGNERLKILCGGEILPRDLAVRLSARCASLWNMYGPTETTVWSTVHRVDAGNGVVPIGRPIANTKVYVLDAELQPLPVGVAGELYIGGEGLSRGYLNRPELTAERFIPDPFGDDDEGRLYKTGDLARYLPDGSIECLGRLDDQAKIRGFRIEPGEVETVLARHPGVKHAVVVAREDTPGDKRLVAYLITSREPAPSVGDLQGFLKQKLPEYMVPSAFVFVEAFPITPNGKVDRRALPAPERDRPRLETALIAPRDDLERQLTEIWEDLLGHAPIGVKDSFFELGGHSLLAAKLVHRVEKTLGKTLPVVTVFQAPTIEQLAETLRQRSPSPNRSSVVPLQSNGARAPFFFLAGRSHFGNRLGSDRPVYRVVYQDLDRDQPLVRIEDMAAHSIRSLRTVQPDGPYYLGGHGIGGVVAFEVACQLQREGHKVAALIICESRAPGSKGPGLGASSLYRLWQRASYHFDRAHHTGLRQEIANILRNLNNKLQRGRWLRGPVLRSRSRAGYRGAIHEALQRYVPQLYSGRITLIRCAERPSWRDEDTRNGWDSLVTGGVGEHEIPGTHTSIYTEPNVRVLTRTLNDVLDKAQTGVASEGVRFTEKRPATDPVKSYDSIELNETEH